MLLIINVKIIVIASCKMSMCVKFSAKMTRLRDKLHHSSRNSLSFTLIIFLLNVTLFYTSLQAKYAENNVNLSH